MVSALPVRSENSHHVSMIENYPATLEVLGEPIRQVGGVTLAFLVSTDVEDIVNMCFQYSLPVLETRGPSKCGKALQEFGHPRGVTTATFSCSRTTA